MNRTDFIQLDQYYDQPPAAVWRAITQPELLARWWAAGDVRPLVGHKFELDMDNWGGGPRCSRDSARPSQSFKHGLI